MKAVAVTGAAAGARAMLGAGAAVLGVVAVVAGEVLAVVDRTVYGCGKGKDSRSPEGVKAGSSSTTRKNGAEVQLTLKDRHK